MMISLIKSLLQLQLVCLLVVARHPGVTRNSDEVEGKISSADLPEGYVPFFDHQVAYKIHERLATWNEARERCMGEGGHLAIADSREKIEHIKSMNNHTENWLHVGIYHSANGDDWVRVDNDLPVASVPWAYGDPFRTGSCVGISLVGSGLLNYRCSEKREYFVCEVPIFRDDDNGETTTSEVPVTQEIQATDQPTTIPDDDGTTEWFTTEGEDSTTVSEVSTVFETQYFETTPEDYFTRYYSYPSTERPNIEVPVTQEIQATDQPTTIPDDDGTTEWFTTEGEDSTTVSEVSTVFETDYSEITTEDHSYPVTEETTIAVPVTEEIQATDSPSTDSYNDVTSTHGTPEWYTTEVPVSETGAYTTSDAEYFETTTENFSYPTEGESTTEGIETTNQLPSNLLAEGYEMAKYDDNVAYKFHRNYVSWNEARDICESEGSDLAVPDGASQKEEFIGYADEWDADWPHVGLRRSSRHDYWIRTETGRYFHTLSWSQVGPYSRNGYNCVGMSRRRKDFIMYSCDSYKKPFICAKSI